MLKSFLLSLYHAFQVNYVPVAHGISANLVFDCQDAEINFRITKFEQWFYLKATAENFGQCEEILTVTKLYQHGTQIAETYAVFVKNQQPTTIRMGRFRLKNHKVQFEAMYVD